MLPVVLWLVYAVPAYVVYTLVFRLRYGFSPVVEHLPPRDLYGWMDSILFVVLSGYSGWLLLGAWPLQNAAINLPAGAALWGVGVALRGWAMAVLGRHWRIGQDVNDSRAEFVARGPYRILRHPINAALIVVAAGMVLMCGLHTRELMLLGYAVVYYSVQGRLENQRWKQGWNRENRDGEHRPRGEEIDASLYFKQPGDDVRVLVVHSTADDLGKKTAASLTAALAPGVQIVGVERCSDFRELVRIVSSSTPFNVLLVVAHGNAAANRIRLFGDVDAKGRVLRVSVGELKAALEGHADDILALFGVCHLGSENLAEAVVEQAGALACVAPKPGCTISGRDVVAGYGSLLSRMQSRKHEGIGPYELPDLLRTTMSPELLKRLSIAPAL